ncbi:nucleoside-diphosphate kinase [Streptococcus sanguinis]|uniref:hypothetical protein n=2 Tax=Streptococcus sanguinis TaxID=1305 RepID=UPI001CC0BFB4|nr:hypothetical protein [Streptococcus sanguinis]MBZ2040300.1 hypothetical protein [Streptococcus sanguinis]
MEKSLIIIKPDLEKNLVGKEKLINLISGSGLTVYDTSQIVFNNWMIENMWPQFQSDVISMRILSNYLDKKKLEILYLEGENALENTLKIKKKIRDEFSRSPFQSCLHTPANFNEYQHNIDIINGIESNKYYPSKVPPQFIPLEELGYSVEFLINTADLLWNILNKGRESLFKIHESLISKKAFSLILTNCNHPHYNISIEYVVASILLVNPSLELTTVYISTMVAIMKGEAVLFTSDDLVYLEDTCSKLLSKLIICKVVVSE